MDPKENPVDEAQQAHDTSLAVWEVHSPFVAGQRTTVIVGLKCSAGCDLNHREVGIADEAGGPLAAAQLGATPWPGTAALYWATLELTIPPQSGKHTWFATFAGSEKEGHKGTTAPLTFMVLKAPEHRVEVRILAEATREPVEGVEVRLDAYRAQTGVSGLAILDVSSGDYELHAWKPGYQLASRKLQITAAAAYELSLAEAVEPEQEYWQ